MPHQLLHSQMISANSLPPMTHTVLTCILRLQIQQKLDKVKLSSLDAKNDVQNLKKMESQLLFVGTSTLTQINGALQI